MAANPVSEARFSLPGKLRMFYVAESLAAAMWETMLRDIAPDDHGRVSIEAHQLRDYRAVRLTLVNAKVACLHFNNPRARHLFPAKSEEMDDLKLLVSMADHARSRDEASALRSELLAMGIHDMPALCWQSNQCSSSQAYLLYEPPMTSGWWSPGATPIAMDSANGHLLLSAELLAHGFHWAPGDAV
ncbi:RES domain-containing protein [Xanthomonas campestris]|uniref:RES domain-containing protein n=1 Tax=Xanthomonas campestris TaxID=339 RepID=UPI002B22FFD2|nr:RES domain-containing protein [Xanthomonas campestris]